MGKAPRFAFLSILAAAFAFSGTAYTGLDSLAKYRPESYEESLNEGLWDGEVDGSEKGEADGFEKGRADGERHDDLGRSLGHLEDLFDEVLLEELADDKDDETRSYNAGYAYAHLVAWTYAWYYGYGKGFCSALPRSERVEWLQIADQTLVADPFFGEEGPLFSTGPSECWPRRYKPVSDDPPYDEWREADAPDEDPWSGEDYFPGDDPCANDCTDMDGDGRTWNDVDADDDGMYETP